MNRRTIFFIIGLLTLPFILTLGPIFLAPILCCIAIKKLCNDWNRNLRRCMCCVHICCVFFCILPFFLIFFVLSIALGIVAGALAGTILLIPAYVLHIYLYSRTVYWWNQEKIDKREEKNQETKKI